MVGELISRELSLLTGTDVVPETTYHEVAGKVPVAADHDLVVHLVVDGKGTRLAALLKAGQIERLARQAQARGTIKPDPDLQVGPAAAALSVRALRRTVGLLAHLQSTTYLRPTAMSTPLNTPAERGACAVVFRAQGARAGTFRLDIGAVWPLELVLVLPSEAVAGAVAGMGDPLIYRQARTRFLEEVGGDADLPEETADAEPDIVLRDPADLLFGQSFFPQDRMRELLREVGAAVTVRPVELRTGPPLVALRPQGKKLLLHRGTPVLKGASLFVVDPADLEACKQQTTVGAGGFLLEHMLFDGAFEGAYYVARTDHRECRTFCMTYVLAVGEHQCRFEHYVPMDVVADMVGPDATVLREGNRNALLMLLRYNTHVAAVALEDPHRAQDWLGPVLGDENVPLSRPGEEAPDPYDFAAFQSLPKAQMMKLFLWPSVKALRPRELACAFFDADARLRKRVMACLSTARAELFGKSFEKAGWSVQEIWKTQYRVANRLYLALAYNGFRMSYRLACQHLHCLRYFEAEWRVLGAAQLKEQFGFLPSMMEFNRLKDLSDQAFRTILGYGDVAEGGDGFLIGLLVWPKYDEVNRRILANVSEGRRKRVDLEIRTKRASGKWSHVHSMHLQDIFTRAAYFLSLAGRIEVTPEFEEAVDDYLRELDVELEGRARAMLKDDTFDRLMTALDRRELRIAQELAGHETYKWALVDCPREVFGQVTAELLPLAVADLRESLELLGRRVPDEGKRLNLIANARVRLLDAARLLIKFRDVEARGAGKRRRKGRRDA